MQRKDLKYYLGLNYPITIEKYTEYDEKEYFAVEIPDLPGCGAEGKTIEEALKNLEEAKRAWIEVSIEKGLDIPEPATEDQFSGKFLLRIPARLHRKLALNAKKANTSLNQYIRSVLESALHEDQVIKLLEEQKKEIQPALAMIVRRGAYVKLETGKLTVQLRRFKNPEIDYAARELCDDLNKMKPHTLDKFCLPIHYEVI